jgi:hypothetical protein
LVEVNKRVRRLNRHVEIEIPDLKLAQPPLTAYENESIFVQSGIFERILTFGIE